jgi:GNAT superfamily N-acetyltransferase
MKIEPAQSESDWYTASKLLLNVVEKLNKLDKPLWTEDQISIAGLKKSYKLNELYFLTESETIGVVFLQESDPFFWPEVVQNNSLFVHKLAIDPRFSGAKLGQKVLQLIFLEACNRGYDWVRLDCDDRPELHKFYSDSGFALVDIKNMEEFRVARYQRATRTPT